MNQFINEKETHEDDLTLSHTQLDVHLSAHDDLVMPGEERLERSVSNPRQLRKNELLLILADMGLNTTMADQVIDQEGINIYDTPLHEVLDHLLERIIQREQERASLELLEQIHEINGELNNDIQINSFTQYARRDKQGPKLQIFQEQRYDDNEPKLECMICLDDKSYSHMQSEFGLPCLEHRFCQECIKQYLEDCIKNSRVESITCPDQACMHVYPDAYIKSQVSDFNFEKYKRFQRIQLVSRDPMVRWCPKEGCQDYAVGPPLKRDSKVICPCSQAICFDCRHEYHGQQSCETALGSLYRQAVKKFIIIGCPKCKSPIQKEGGCNHMTCYHCRYEFCWLCGRRYWSNHYRRMSLIGCHGTQYGQQKPSSHPILILVLLVLPRLLYWMLYGVWLLVKSLFFLALFIVVVGIGLPHYLAKNHTIGMSNVLKSRQERKCAFYSLTISLILLGLVLFPLNLALAICPGVCLFIKKQIA